MKFHKKLQKGIKLNNDDMHLHDETKIEHGIQWTVRFDHGHVTIIARNLTTGDRHISEKDYPFSYRDGYSADDMLTIYREIDDCIEELRDE